MLVDILRDQNISGNLDVARAGRELPHQHIRHPRDLKRRVTPLSPLPHLPTEAKITSEMVGENRVVMLRQGDDRGVHRTTIQGPPLPIMSTLHLVYDHHMSVQLRIGRPAVVMVVRRRNHAKDIHLRNRPVPDIRTNPGHGNVTLHQIDDLCNGRMMRLHDHRLRATIGNSPQRADTLRDRERIIEPRNSTATMPNVLLRLDIGDRLRPLSDTQPCRELPDAGVDSLRRGLEVQPRLPERFAGDGIATQPEKELQVRLRHRPARFELTITETMNTGPHPETRRCSLLLVVPRQRRRQIPVPVASDHRFQQVSKTVASGHHSH
jgi:hypothetical protein